MITALVVLALGLKVALMTVHAYAEHNFARWLPWWRRYLSILCWILHWILVFGSDRVWPQLLSNLVAVFVFGWNIRTATRNRDRGDDQRKREAQAGETRLTDVQTAALQREARACV